MDVQGILEVFFNNPSNDEHDYSPPERELHNRISRYYEDIVLIYSLTDFKSHFRVEKRTHERLVQDLGQRLYRDQAEKISPGKQIIITLWFFGNQEVYTDQLRIDLEYPKILFGIAYLK